MGLKYKAVRDIYPYSDVWEMFIQSWVSSHQHPPAARVPKKLALLLKFIILSIYYKFY